MKPFFVEAINPYDASLTVRQDILPHLYNHWHFHDEYEIVYIIESTGIRIVGDSLHSFKPGDLVLLGSRLPHIWLNDPVYFQPQGQFRANAIVIHLKRNFIHNGFFEIPSLQRVRQIFTSSSRGLHFPVSGLVSELLFSILHSEGVNRIIHCFALFRELIDCQNATFLASEGYIRSFVPGKTMRLNKVYDYIAANFTRKIRLDEMADLLHITPKAFCHYFKKTTRHTLFEYINNLRIGYACKKLIEKDMNISSVAHESGFNNVSQFNRLFKRIMNTTPLQYRASFTLLNKV